MSQRLIAGQNCSVPQEILHVVVTAQAPADVSSFRLSADGKTRRDEDFIFYGQTANEDKTVCYTASGLTTTFEVDLRRMRDDAEKIAFAITADASAASPGQVQLDITQAGASLLSCEMDMASRKEAALILGELYKRNGAWKFRFVAQGFNGGLKPLAEFFGVDIAEDAPKTPAAPPPPVPSAINLSKVTLTKEKPRVDLKKQDVASGLFRINLNWQQKSAAPPKQGFLAGLLSGGKNAGGIDLDLGAFIRLENGDRTIVQALGDRFGALDAEPYVLLLGDDRTGAQSEGEWLHINGKKFDKIQEVLVYAFIYEGVPNWAATDGVVTLHIPGQPEIETRLSEGNDRLPMCAIARISNQHGDVRVERINQYFHGHKDMDKALGWGFRWVAGSK